MSGGNDGMRLRRRDVLIAGASLLLVGPAAATPDAMQAAIRAVVGEAPIHRGKVTLELPPLVDNGASAPLAVSVASPMSATDYVKAIHVFNEKNPQPNVISVRLGPRAGKARFATRVRLAASQTIVAVAELSDGSFWSASAEVSVTVGGCDEEVL